MPTPRRRLRSAGPARPPAAALADPFDAAPACLAVCDGPDHVVARANLAFRALFPAQDPTGRALADAWPDLVARVGRRALDRVYTHGATARASEAAVRTGRDGGAAGEADAAGEGSGDEHPGDGDGDGDDERFVDVVLTPRRGPRGAIAGVLVCATDVTARVRARWISDAAAALLGAATDVREGLARVARLLVPTLGDVCAVDLARADGAIERVATAHVDPEGARLACALAGVYPARPDAAGGSARVARTGAPEVVRALRDPARVALAPDAPSHLGALRAMALRSSLTVPLVAHGEPVGALWLATTDVSRRRFARADVPLVQDVAARVALALRAAQLLDEARAAVRARDEFFALATHEFKTPLGVLRLRLEMLAWEAARRAELPSAEVRPLVAAAEESLARLSALVDAFLAVAVARHGPLVLDLTRADLAETVRDAAGRLAGLAARAGCELTVRADAPVVGVWDTLRIEQIVANLLTNAFKYGAGTPVEVSVTAEGRVARLTVTDRGRGIADVDHTRIFERFERAAPAPDAHSLGLGLHVVRELVRAHGGRIAVRSRPGEGATFVVELPLDGPPREG